MSEVWWESVASFMCKYWWVLLVIIVLAITAYFTRQYWMPALGL